MISFLQHDLNIWGNYEAYFFNSDALHFNGISKNILERDGSFKDWLLGGAPRYFPTILLTFFIALVTKNYFFTQIIFLVIQICLFNYLLIKILDNYIENRYNVLMVAILNFLHFYFFHFAPCNYLFMTDHHFGTFLNFLICLVFILKVNENKLINVFFFNLMILLFTFSNPIFLILFVIPLVVRNFFILDKSIKIISINLSYLFSSIIGIIVKKYIYNHDDCTECTISYQKSVDSITFSHIEISLYHIKEFFLSHSNYFQNILAMLSIFIPLLFFYNLYEKKELQNNSNKLSIFIILFVSSLITISSFTFLRINPQFRHLYTIYYSGIILLPILLRSYIVRFFDIYYLKSLIFSLIFISIFSLKSINFNKKLNSDFYPDEIQFIDKILLDHDLDRGIAKFGIANKLIFFSKRALKIIPHHTIKPLHWNINKKWIIKERPEFIINMDPSIFGYDFFKKYNYKLIDLYIL